MRFRWLPCGSRDAWTWLEKRQCLFHTVNDLERSASCPLKSTIHGSPHYKMSRVCSHRRQTLEEQGGSSPESPPPERHSELQLRQRSRQRDRIQQGATPISCCQARDSDKAAMEDSTDRNRSDAPSRGEEAERQHPYRSDCTPVLNATLFDPGACPQHQDLSHRVATL